MRMDGRVASIHLIKNNFINIVWKVGINLLSLLKTWLKRYSHFIRENMTGLQRIVKRSLKK